MVTLKSGLKFLGLAVLGVFMTVGYQNCAPGFVASSDLLSSSSIEELPSQDLSTDLGAYPKPQQCLAQKTTAEIAQSPLRRLTKPEMKGAFASIFGAAFMARTQVAPAFNIMNDEVLTGNLPSEDFEIPLMALVGIVDQVVNYAESVKFQGVSKIGTCDGSKSAVCKTWFLSTAERSYKRLLTTAERTELGTFFDTLGLSASLKRILLSPNFSTHLELTSEETKTLRRLTSFEVAHRISFGLTHGLPDETLWTAARNNQLTTVAEISPHIARILASTEGKAAIIDKMLLWLRLETVTDPSTVIAQVNGFQAAGYGLEAQEEMRKFIDYIVFQKRGTFRDLLTDKTVFPFSDRLALNTGLTKSNGARVFADFRGGILMRPASLVSGSKETSPIQRGVFVRKRLLCQEIPPPSDDVLLSRIDSLNSFSHEEFSNRHIVTETTKGSCMGCHNMINPIGYVLESIDPFGMPRTSESIFSETGTLVARHQIDTVVGDLALDASPNTTESASGPDDLSRVISRSPQAMSCFGKVLVETTRQKARGDFETCVGEDLAEKAYQGKPIVELLTESLAKEDTFWLRK